MSATTPTTNVMSAGLRSRSGRGTIGSRFSTSSPRPGRLAPRRKRARTMTRKTNSSDSPRIGAPPVSVGNQLCVDQYTRSDWTTPIERPAKQAMKNDVKPASRAAPRAGTTWNASDCASSAISGATRTPSPPATTQARTVFTTARRLGDRPASIAETSSSDAALVDSPKRVQRYSAASTAATTITIPASMNRSFGTIRSKIVTVPVGRIAGADFVVLPKIRITPACSTRRRPREAASLASGAAFRSGRKMASSTRTPNPAMQASVSTKAGATRARNRSSRS